MKTTTQQSADPLDIASNTEKIRAILGERVPVGATAFHTTYGLGEFLMGASAKFVSIELSETDKEQLKAAGLLGSFGWQIDTKIL